MPDTLRIGEGAEHPVPRNVIDGPPIRCCSIGGITPFVYAPCTACLLDWSYIPWAAVIIVSTKLYPPTLVPTANVLPVMRSNLIGRVNHVFG